MIHRGKYHLATIKPSVKISGNLAYSANDILWDWHSFEVPRGGFCMKSFHAIVAGTNKAAAAGVDIELFYATTVNGVAPPSLGAANAATSIIATTACKPHIIGRQYIDASAVEDGDRLIGYNVWSDGGGGALGLGTAKLNNHEMVLEGDPNYIGDATRGYSATTKGYQTLWVAAFTIGAPDKGTGVLLNKDGGQAASTGGDGRGGAVSTKVTLVTDGSDADDVFGIGDELMAFAADGSSPAIIGSVISVAANSITVNEVAAAIADDDEIVFRHPYVLKLGIEY